MVVAFGSMLLAAQIMTSAHEEMNRMRQMRARTALTYDAVPRVSAR